MAALDRSLIEAARNLGASRLRVLFGIVLPQVRGAAAGRLRAHLRHDDVGAVGAGDDQRRHRRRMITVDMAYRITTFGDYGVGECARRDLLSADRWRRAGSISATQRGSEGAARDPRAADAARRWSCCSPSPSSGRSLNLVLWAFAERWFWPHALPLAIRVQLLGPRVRAARRRLDVARHQRADRGADRGRSALALAIPAGYALARLRLPVRGAVMLLLPAAAGVPEPADLHQHRAAVLPRRAERHGRRRRAGALRCTGSCSRCGSPRRRSPRVDRAAGGGGAQPRRRAAALPSRP